MSQKIDQIISQSAEQFSSFLESGLEHNIEFFKDLIEDFKDEDEGAVIDGQFIKELAPILKKANFKACPQITHYLASLLDQLLMIEELMAEFDDAPEELAVELEQEIFSFWADSEFSDVLQEEMQLGRVLPDISMELSAVLQEQILSFSYLHFTSDKAKLEKPLNYFPVKELGEDGNSLLIIGQDSKLHYLYSSNQLDEGDRYIQLLEINRSNQTTEVTALNALGKKVIFLEVLSMRPSVIDNLNIIYQHSFSSEKNKEIVESLQASTQFFKEYLSNLYKIIKVGTQFIYPHTEKGIVSYSTQTAPGFSHLNFLERDRLDQLDDLLHENGHHYLNSILEQHELIIEDDEKIFFSPWRKQLRPIRGIFHAQLTFFWAYYLYFELYRLMISDKGSSLFTEEEKIKITHRLLEESLLIELGFKELDKAEAKEKTTEEGTQLIEQFREMANHRDIQAVIKILKETDDGKNYYKTLETEINEKIESCQIA